MVTLQLAVDIVLNMAGAYGDDATWLGCEVVGKGPVLFYSGEGGAVMLRDRLRKIAPPDGADIAPLFVRADCPRPMLDVDRDLDEVFAYAEHLAAVLLVFDPMSRFWAMQDEADPHLARNLMEGIQARALGAYEGRGCRRTRREFACGQFKYPGGVFRHFLYGFGR